MGIIPDEALPKVEKAFAMKYLFISFSLIVMALLQHLCKYRNIPFYTSGFCVIWGIVWGVIAMYSKFFYTMVLSTQTDAILQQITDILIAMLIYSAAFLMDINIFLKCLPQVLIIGIPVFLLTGVLNCHMMLLVIDPSAKVADDLMLGQLTAMVYCVDILKYFKNSNVEIKHMATLLQGETVISTSISLLFYDILTGYTTGWMAKWYHGAMGIVRMFSLGIPIGCIFGFFGSYCMQCSYNDASSLLLLTICSCFTSFYVGLWIANGGVLTVMITGVIMGMERTSLPQKVQLTLDSTWKMLCTVFGGICCIIVGIHTPFFLTDHVTFKEYVLIIVTYLVTNVSRFVSFLLFSPVLSRVGYGMSFRDLILAVWCGLKSPLSLTLVVDLEEIHNKEKMAVLYAHVVGLYLMSMINAAFVPVLLKAAGMGDLSLIKQANLNNCMRAIYDARARTIAILKMDRFLSDANWPLVLNSTNLKHPYKKYGLVENPEDEDQFFLGYRFTYCPDCQKHVPKEPTKKELNEMIKEAKLRLLKLKKTCYSRQYQKGLLSREGARILHQAVEIAMDSEDPVIELDGLFKMFAKEGVIYRHLLNYMNHLLQEKAHSYRQPKRRFRLFCHRVVKHFAFFVAVNVVLALNIAYIVLHMFFQKLTPLWLALTADGFFFCFYVVESWMKILGYSWRSLCRHGFRKYFGSFSGVVKFLVVCCIFVDVVVILVDDHSLVVLYVVDLAWLTLVSIRTVRYLLRLKIFSCWKPLPNAILKYLHSKVNKHRALAFELGKNYRSGEEEILDNLEQIIDNDQIRAMMKEQIEDARLAVSRKLAILQGEKAWVASTVKTKTVIRTVLNSMKDEVYDLKLAGWVDDVEYNQLLNSLAEKYKYINSIQFIQPAPPKNLFKSIGYMGENEDLKEFLFANVATKKFDPGTMVVQDGEPSGGIYIIITGLFFISYLPNGPVLTLMREEGAIPVTDYICNNKYTEHTTEYFLPGVTFGELSCISGRSYVAMVTAVTHSEVFFLNEVVVKKAFAMDPDPVKGLECRIWKVIAFNRALNILMDVPVFRTYTQDKIKYLLQRGFVPNLENYKVFVVSEMMEDIILIEGKCTDFNSKHVYVAPCYIPRAVQRLILGKYTSDEFTIIPKLLIIPAKDYDEYDVMLYQEEIAELVSHAPEKSLHVFVQEKLENENRLLARRLRRSMATSISSKSRTTLESASISRKSYM